MSLSNSAPLDSTTIKTVQAAFSIVGYIHANPRWSLKIKPDEMDLIYFIVMNYSEPGQTSTSSFGMSISTARNLASDQLYFPKSWLRHKKLGRKATKVFLKDAKQVFMTDAFHDWKKQVFTTSILDLPNELLQFIAAPLPQNTLISLCQLNRLFSNVIGAELWRPLNRVFMALEWSLRHCQLTVYEKTIEELSRIPGRTNHEFTWKLFPMINANNIHMLQCMASKGGFIGKLYRQFLVDTLLHNLKNPNWHKETRHLSVKEVLEQGTDLNCLSDYPFLLELNYGLIPILFTAICSTHSLCADTLEHEIEIPCSLSRRTGNVRNVQLLLEYGADPKIYISDKTSALHVAVSLCKSLGKSDIVTELIKNGANVNKIGPHGKTPLHMAVGRNHCYRHKIPCKNTINALLQTPGIELDQRDEDGRTPLSIAASVNSSVSA
ncbi:uncharacterized protein N7479_011066 [Penicillium vulpinum]|uniref:F-box domain-containing protein n=1 Tax=Penicillium vulpinum TaxID=29845 RepID=A0A1V6RT92_9EURO|nr:uncharacterized protein N7479_011066 [Penicillium vulpinum]KAJ5952653.1 hypothetical protein N7479_011066 [Penicillium vulpinum]OQE04846.1 hypothetical protein PENVUL_c029G03900 [Penicillium vulpinum]